MENYFSRRIDDKYIVWFGQTNQYVWMEAPAYEVFEQLNNNIPHSQIAEILFENYDLPIVEGLGFIVDVEQLIKNTLSINPEDSAPIKDILPEEDPFSEKHYSFNKISFSFQYSHKRLEEMFHPRLKHLEIKRIDRAPPKGETYVFHLYKAEEKLHLRVNDKLISSWPLKELHYFQGKVSAEFLDKAYNMQEKDWIGVFHASALSDGTNSIIMPGESGSGKSTSLAILHTAGFHVLADDFVPMQADPPKLKLFPSAISVKEGSWDMIRKIYPDFDSTGEIYRKDESTRMIYMPPNMPDNPEDFSAPVKAVVFIKYSEGSETKLELMGKDLAFSELVTDSWISPLPENVERFLNWFFELPAYRLTYSQNEQMVDTIRRIFNDEL